MKEDNYGYDSDAAYQDQYPVTGGQGVAGALKKAGLGKLLKGKKIGTPDPVRDKSKTKPKTWEPHPGIQGAQITDDYDEPASPDEGSMLDNQIAFIKYAADEIKDHVHAGGVFPEWFQNKLSGVHEKIKTLHAYLEGERQQEKERSERKEMVSMKDIKDDYFESLESKLSEAKKKGVDGKVCWDGYKRMGTKKKGGKTVDNCVKMASKEKNK